jgi:hypothetical protein
MSNSTDRKFPGGLTAKEVLDRQQERLKKEKKNK